MEMIEMGVGQQHQINGGQVLDSQTGAFDAFEQEEPVGKVRINQNIQIRELHQKGGVPDPGYGNLPMAQLGKGRLPMLAGASSQQRLPNHLPKERARIEMSGRS